MDSATQKLNKNKNSRQRRRLGRTMKQGGNQSSTNTFYRPGQNNIPHHQSMNPMNFTRAPHRNFPASPWASPYTARTGYQMPFNQQRSPYQSQFGNNPSSSFQQQSNYQSQSAYNLPENPPLSQLTKQQLEFEKEFCKWEKSFDDWKETYANHPDRHFYNEYEARFLDIRDKLLQKRAQIYTIPLKLQLDLQLGAAHKMAENILNKFSDVQSNSSTHRSRSPIQRQPQAPTPGSVSNRRRLLRRQKEKEHRALGRASKTEPVEQGTPKPDYRIR